MYEPWSCTASTARKVKFRNFLDYFISYSESESALLMALMAVSFFLLAVLAISSFWPSDRGIFFLYLVTRAPTCELRLDV